MDFSKFVYLISFFIMCHGKLDEWNNDGECPSLTTNCTKLHYKYTEDNSIDAPVWYMPLYSKYELYHTSSLISGIPVKDLTDSDIKKACLTMSEEEPGIYIYKGFNGKQIDVETSPAEDGGLMWKLRGESKFRGELYITLATDDYAVTVTCWGSGHKSFSAASKNKTFDSKTLGIIVEHVKSLGFSPRHFVHYNYDECDKKHETEVEGESFCSFTYVINSFWKMIGY